MTDVETIAEAHQWHGGYVCSCGHELNSPLGFTRHVLEVAERSVPKLVLADPPEGDLPSHLPGGMWVIPETIPEELDRLRGVVARVEALADEGFWFVRFYGDTCGTCHSVTSAHQINPAGVLRGDETPGQPGAPVEAAEAAERAQMGAEGTTRLDRTWDRSGPTGEALS